MPYIVIGGVLYHYGIPGMRWGHRRFQNKDGSLTEAGKRRYAERVIKSTKRNKSNLYKVQKMIGEDIESGKLTSLQSAKVRKVLEAREKYRDELNEIEFGFEDSPEYDAAMKAARDKSLKYLRDNDPEELKDIESIMRETGRDYGDFKQIDDLDEHFYFEDGVKDQFLGEFMRRTGTNPDASLKEYREVCHDLSESLLGDYGNVRLPLKLDAYGTDMHTLSDYLGEAAADALFDYMYMRKETL